LTAVLEQQIRSTYNCQIENEAQYNRSPFNPLDFAKNGTCKKRFSYARSCFQNWNFLSAKLRSKHMLLQIRSTYELNLKEYRSKMY